MEVLSNRYQIISPLGSGGFSQTFLAKDTHLPGHPDCVVKKLQPQETDEETMEVAKRLFNTEAEVLQRLGKKHEQIPELLAYFADNQQFYLIQEYIEGDLLRKTIGNGKKWQEIAVIELLEDLLPVLSFLEENKVIHRDIKPDNLIKRQQTNKIVLIDFGAVKEVICPHNGKLTIPIHTRGYAPHEQSIGQPRYSSDVYALGMVAIEALTGNSPLSLIQEAPKVEWGEYLTEVLKHQVRDELISILGKMTHPNYEKRYASAREALTAINHLNGHENDGIPTTIESIPTIKEQTGNNVTLINHLNGHENNMIPTTIESIPTIKEQKDNNVTVNSHKWVFFSVLLLLLGVISGYGLFYAVENLNEPPKDKPGLFNNF